MVHQIALTVRAKIKPGRMEMLNRELKIIRDDIEGNELIPFAQLRGIHFARFVILDVAADLNGNSIDPTLVFAVNVDSPLESQIEEMIALASEGIDRVFSNCDDYPIPGERRKDSRLAFLLAHRIETQAFYVNTIGRTAAQVQQEAGLRDEIEKVIDNLQRTADISSWSAGRIRETIQDNVRRDLSLAWAFKPAVKHSLWWRTKNIIYRVLIFLGVLVVLPLLIVALPPFLMLLRYHEKRDARQSNLRLNSLSRARLENFEDQVVQNQISAVGDLKPGLFRLLTVRALLLALKIAARYVYNNGDLGTVKLLGLAGVNTIHFAQWIMIDGGRRMLFFSNYDGSLVSYMDDFVNKVAWGLNAVFSNGALYPKTDWLFLNGAHDEQAFKAFLQTHQIPTQAWYSAYKHYTALNLTNNSRVRDGLPAHLDEYESAAWLQRL
jgi:hypothetical protein